MIITIEKIINKETDILDFYMKANDVTKESMDRLVKALNRFNLIYSQIVYVVREMIAPLVVIKFLEDLENEERR